MYGVVALGVVEVGGAAPGVAGGEAELGAGGGGDCWAQAVSVETDAISATRRPSRRTWPFHVHELRRRADNRAHP